jgi:hypothetical protein
VNCTNALSACCSSVPTDPQGCSGCHSQPEGCA